MKYLKKFNESKTGIEIDINSIDNLKNSINNELFTPVKEEVPLKSIYKAIVVKTQYPINTKNVITNTSGYYSEGGKVVKIYDTNWILLEYRFGSFGVSFYPDGNSVNEWLKRSGSNFEDNLIIGYNDVNHAEIDNILSEYGIVADEIWGVPI